MTALSPWKFQTCSPQVSQVDFGGKGKGLVLLTEVGLPVPETALFDLTELDSWLKTQGPEYRDFIEAWAFWKLPEAKLYLGAFQKKMSKFPTSAEWAASVDLLSRFLGPGEWLVRSSMSCEDSGSSSFAGCFSSFRVRSQDGARSVGERAFQVLMSAFQLSSLQRVMTAGVDPRIFRTGFLIQKYVSPVLAGVCFTRDPLDLWVNCGGVEWGAHGESVVQGSSEKLQFARRDAERPEPLAPFWDNLWNYSDQIEKKLKAPAEWEWVWDGKILWVVQARQIAAEEARLIARTRPGVKWSRELALERFPEPLSPLGWTVLQDTFQENLLSLDRRFGIRAKRPEDIAVCLNGVVYSDPGFFDFPGGVRIRWNRYLLPWRSEFGSLLRAVVVSLSRIGIGLIKAGKSKSYRNLSRAMARLCFVDALLGTQASEIEEGWASHRDRCMGLLSSLHEDRGERGREGELAGEILAEMEDLRKLSIDFLEPDLAIFLIKDSCYKALLGVWSALGKPQEGLAPLIRLSQGNRTLEMNLQWQTFVSEMRLESEGIFEKFCTDLGGARDASEAVRVSANLQSETRKAWEDFLTRNGHSRTSWDVAVAGWGENPAQLIPVMRAARQSRKPSHLQIRPHSERGALDEFKSALMEPNCSTRHDLLERVLKRVEDFMRIDEEQHFLSGLLLDASRNLIQKGAEILVQEGLLKKRDDVFFLQLGELKALLNATPSHRRSMCLLVEKRRAEWKRSFASRHPLELAIGMAMGAVSTASVPSGMALGTKLKGVPVSPGEATGRVHIADHLGEAARLLDGADRAEGVVLITTSPNPALTPLYPFLAGLISVTGGPLSHGFVAAREYGLPAVSGIPQATQLFRPGMSVRLNGTSGDIEILSEILGERLPGSLPDRLPGRLEDSLEQEVFL